MGRNVVAILLSAVVIGLVLFGNAPTTSGGPAIQPTPTPTSSPTAPACRDAWRQIDNDDRKSGNRIEGIAAVSADTAWAVGDARTPSGRPDPLIKKWNGSQWNRDPVSGSFYLHDVDVGASGPVWAVGEGSSGTTLSSVALRRTASGEWRRSAIRNPSPTLSAINDVSALSKNHAWASGTYWDSAGQHRVLIEHWNGRGWKVAPVSKIGLLDDVFARSRDDVWAVGRTVRNGRPVTLTLRFNGKRWRHVPSPNVTDRPHYLYGVSASGRRNAWAVGERDAGRGSVRPVVMSWDGNGWRLRNTGLPDRSRAGVRGVSVFGDEVVVVGHYTHPNGASEGLILTWDGQRWTREDLSRFEDADELHDVEHAPNGSVYAAGWRSTSNGSEAVFFRPPLCP